SLIATILLYMGVALFCGCGHEALSGTVTILQNYFEKKYQDIYRINISGYDFCIDILKYIIYGLAAGFFVFGVLLLVEGFFTTGAIRDLYGEFKITACGRCLTAFFVFTFASSCPRHSHPVPLLCRPQLMFLAYLFFLVWLGVTAFTSLPVFMYFNVWSMCQNTSVVEGANLCLDLRQFGKINPCSWPKRRYRTGQGETRWIFKTQRQDSVAHGPFLCVSFVLEIFDVLVYNCKEKQETLIVMQGKQMSVCSGKNP
uniref:Neuronal membrane glycoprotein M6-a n=1 Tax=Neogobius melanostomus TaxID=47308 RepID=A0A8C6SUG1_9GOBI